MIRLLRTVSWLVRWVTRTPRRVIGVLALPILLGVALAAGPIGDRSPDGSGDVLAGGPTAAPPASPTGPRSTVFPGTTGAPTPVAPRPTPELAAAQRAAAVGYVTAANSHDARPGKDKAFTDSYTRTRPYVTPELFALVTEPSRRGDYEWAQWTAARATVAVQVLATGVPDGAPAPTATTAYARVQFRQVVTPTAGASAGQSIDGAVNVLVTKVGDRWLVSKLLADT